MPYVKANQAQTHATHSFCFLHHVIITCCVPPLLHVLALYNLLNLLQIHKFNHPFAFRDQRIFPSTTSTFNLYRLGSESLYLLGLTYNPPYPREFYYQPRPPVVLDASALPIMSVLNDLEMITPSVSPPDSITAQKNVDHDAFKLGEMGYTQDMQRKFSVWSVLAVGFSLTNSWFAISAALVTGINSGGPVLLIYGIIGIALISICVGVTLSELASAFPNAGGQYYWASVLASKRYANFPAYLTGWFAWTGSIFTCAAVALAMGSATVGCWQLTHPDL